MIRAVVAVGLLLSAGAASPHLGQAFRAAFGKSGVATIVSTSGDIRETVKYVPGALVDAPFGPILVAPGEVIDAAHASSGKIAAVYLRKTAKGYGVARRYVPAMETGSFGKIASWSMSNAFGPFPVVMVEGGGTWQGYTCSVTTLLELAPDGPHELVTIPMSYDDSGAAGDDKAKIIDGKIADIRAGRMFDVVYSGSRHFTERYERRGRGYVLVGGGESGMETC
jgi:hypothetical protein